MAGVPATPVLLVVEDNLEQRTLLREFLPEIVRCDLKEASDSNTALVHLRDCRPDIVLLDLHVPPRGGQAILHAIADDPYLADVRVIVLSGSRAPADLALIDNDYVFRFLEKPYNLDDLEDAVRAALDLDA
jgi:CheY-like chemotaxis protein